MSKLKIGTIGAGQIASDHISSIIRHKEAEIIAIADPSINRANELAKQFSISKVYSSTEEILKNKNIDAVTIAVPNKFHADYSIAALNAGKHVMLDKPFALNINEAEAVVKAAKTNNKVLMVGMNQRFSPESQIIKSLVDAGKLGEIYHAKACWRRRSGSPKFGTWFCHKEESGGGAMLDIGVHMLDLTMYLMNNFKPFSVFGSVYTKICNRGKGEGSWGKSDKIDPIFDVDDFATALIKFENGATISLDASWALHQPESDVCNVQLFGDEGGAVARPIAKFYKYSETYENGYDIFEMGKGNLRYPHCNRIINWIDSILGIDELCCKPEQSLAVQKILDGIYESSKTGREIIIK